MPICLALECQNMFKIWQPDRCWTNCLPIKTHRSSESHILHTMVIRNGFHKSHGLNCFLFWLGLSHNDHFDIKMEFIVPQYYYSWKVYFLLINLFIPNTHTHTHWWRETLGFGNKTILEQNGHDLSKYQSNFNVSKYKWNDVYKWVDDGSKLYSKE